MGAKKKKTISKIIIYVLLSVVTLIMLLPLLWLLSASFQGPGEIYKIPFNWIPQNIHLENFASAWEMGYMSTAFFSSVCVSVLYLVIHVVWCSLLGYVFAKYHFRFKNALFMIILITMMIPQELTFFPIYTIARDLHLVNTYFGVVFPFCISGFGIFFMRQFCTYVPKELIEAARIDGCGHAKTFVRIALPILKPAISSLVVLAFSFMWDEFAWSKLILNTNEKLTIPVRLTMLALSPTNEIQISELLAASVIAMIPVVILFICFQKQFVESITQGAVKG